MLGLAARMSLGELYVGAAYSQPCNTGPRHKEDVVGIDRPDDLPAGSHVVVGLASRLGPENAGERYFNRSSQSVVGGNGRVVSVRP